MYKFKCEGQGTTEQFEAYNVRLQRIKELQAEWQPYQETILKLKKQFEDAVQHVREQARFIDNEIQTLEQANADNCPHPVEFQKYMEDSDYDDWERQWTFWEWTECTLCGRRPKDETYKRKY